MNRLPIYTRSDLDGLLSCAVLREAGYSGEVEFLNPLDLADGAGTRRQMGIHVNLPGVGEARWDRNCWSGEPWEPRPETAVAAVLESLADSRLTERFSPWLSDLERWQTRKLTLSDVQNPSPVLQMAVICDPATGLGRCRDFIVSNYFFLLDLVDRLRDCPAEAVVQLDDVRDRVALLRDRQEGYEAQMRRTASLQGPLLIHDLRSEALIQPGNLLLRHQWGPPHQAQLTLFWDKNKKRITAAMAAAPMQEPPVPYGELMQRFGGGGDRYTALAQVEPDQVELLVDTLVSELQLTR